MSEETENPSKDEEQEGASPVIDAVAGALQAPKPTVDEAIFPEAFQHGLIRLEQAQALPELEAGEPASTTTGEFTNFKDTDRRTMQVVSVDGVLYKQEV